MKIAIPLKSRNHLSAQVAIFDRIVDLGFCDCGFEQLGDKGTVVWYADRQWLSKKTGRTMQKRWWFVIWPDYEPVQYMSDAEYQDFIVEQLILRKEDRS